jgi:hypothetical protein
MDVGVKTYERLSLLSVLTDNHVHSLQSPVRCDVMWRYHHQLTSLEMTYPEINLNHRVAKSRSYIYFMDMYFLLKIIFCQYSDWATIWTTGVQFPARTGKGLILSVT